MTTADSRLRSTRAPAQPDARTVFRLAYRQSRAMIRDGARHGLGARYVHCMNHLRRRFGASGWPVAQAAARLAFDLRVVSKAATGTVEELARQGMLTRAVRLEPAPRGGWSWAWTHDPLAAVNLNRGYRAYRARQVRAERAAVLAEVEERYELTAKGVAALVAAGMAEDRVALTRGAAPALA